MRDVSQRQIDSTGMPVTRHLPGEAGLWVFIGGDVIVFSLFFAIYIYDFGLYPDIFHASQAHLNHAFAAINTVLLLSSSWFVATAVEAARREKGRISSACLVAALICGIGFCVIKIFEYHEKINEGIMINTNEFYTLYYMYTGIHLVHVLIGLGVLAVMVRVSRKGVLDSKRIFLMEGGASYWHMVDLLWIGLFALLYLVK